MMDNKVNQSQKDPTISRQVLIALRSSQIELWNPPYYVNNEPCYDEIDGLADIILDKQDQTEDDKAAINLALYEFQARSVKKHKNPSKKHCDHRPRPGDRVILKDLANAQDLNGREGVVSGPQDATSGRYPVFLFESPHGDEAMIIQAKPKNMKPFERTRTSPPTVAQTMPMPARAYDISPQETNTNHIKVDITNNGSETSTSKAPEARAAAEFQKPFETSPAPFATASAPPVIIVQDPKPPPDPYAFMAKPSQPLNPQRKYPEGCARCVIITMMVFDILALIIFWPLQFLLLGIGSVVAFVAFLIATILSMILHCTHSGIKTDKGCCACITHILAIGLWVGGVACIISSGFMFFPSDDLDSLMNEVAKSAALYSAGFYMVIFTFVLMLAASIMTCCALCSMNRGYYDD